ncbi:MAG: hypothetical protein LH631_14375 [Alkalinema sp. CAN_BIN05]|nr:hypothetical protein [Alkalinema sp. CAN_BIN05]
MATLTDLNPAIMTAIDRLQYRATVGDVATQSGLNVAIAEQGVLALAAQTGAQMQVTESGDIAYTFPQNFRSTLQAKYWQLRLQAWWDGISGTLFWIVRVMFGCSLFVVLFAILAVGFVMITTMNSNDDNSSDSGGGSGGGWGGSHGGNSYNPGFGSWFIWSGDWLSFGGPKPHDDGKQLSFLETIFSFVFGDGNPNRNLENRRWETIAQRISQSGGAVVAEQLTPYLDVPLNKLDTDEDQYVLPVLVRFNGSPQVTDDGQLIYTFPELQKTVQTTAENDRINMIPDYLEEKSWKLSLGNPTLVTYAAMIGGLILILSLWFTGILPGPISAPAGILRSVSVGALAYSGFYLGLPTLRWLIQGQKNNKIAARNSDRFKRARQLNTPDEVLENKLIQSKTFQQRLRIDQQPIAYDTDRDMLDQDLEQKDKLDAEWQQRLEDRS